MDLSLYLSVHLFLHMQEEEEKEEEIPKSPKSNLQN